MFASLGLLNVNLIVHEMTQMHDFEFGFLPQNFNKFDVECG